MDPIVGTMERVQCVQRRAWPDGELKPWAQKIVEALKAMLPMGLVSIVDDHR